MNWKEDGWKVTAILRQLYSAKSRWEHYVKTTTTALERKRIELPIHQNWESKYSNDYDLDWSKPSLKCSGEISELEARLKRESEEAANWQKIVEFTAEKFDVELYKNAEGLDAWKPKAE